MPFPLVPSESTLVNQVVAFEDSGVSEHCSLLSSALGEEEEEEEEDGETEEDKESLELDVIIRSKAWSQLMKNFRSARGNPLLLQACLIPM